MGSDPALMQYQPPTHAREGPRCPPTLTSSLTLVALFLVVFARGWFGLTAGVLLAVTAGCWVAVRIHRRAPDVTVVDPTGGPTRS